MIHMLVIALLHVTLVVAHGFDVHTSILLANGSLHHIGYICCTALGDEVTVASDDLDSSLQSRAPIVRGGKSTTRCYIHLRLDDRCTKSPQHDAVVCTPTQEFYCVSTARWKPAYLLTVGDELLCAYANRAGVASVRLVDEPLEVYTVEVKRTHIKALM